MITFDNWISELLCLVLEFQAQYKKYLDFYDEPLPYVLMGKLADFASESYAKNNTAVVKRILDFINEAALSPDRAMRGLIRVSFLMHLPRLNGYEAMRTLLNDQAQTLFEQEMRGEVV